MEFKCTICEKSYKSKENFMAHINKHNDDKPYCCSECPAKFFSQSSLITHTKNVQCPVFGEIRMSYVAAQLIGKTILQNLCSR